jgi:hypothetical protein
MVLYIKRGYKIHFNLKILIYWLDRNIYFFDIMIHIKPNRENLEKSHLQTDQSKNHRPKSNR